MPSSVLSSDSMHIGLLAAAAHAAATNSRFTIFYNPRYDDAWRVSNYRYDDAWRVYEALEAINIQPDHVTCSVLITVMRKNGHSARDAWQFFERMNRKGIKWSLEVFGALIKSFCDEGLKKEALIIQSEMEKKSILSIALIFPPLQPQEPWKTSSPKSYGKMQEQKLRKSCSMQEHELQTDEISDFMGTSFLLGLFGGFIFDTYLTRFKTCVVFAMCCIVDQIQDLCCLCNVLYC